MPLLPFRDGLARDWEPGTADSYVSTTDRVEGSDASSRGKEQRRGVSLIVVVCR